MTGARQLYGLFTAGTLLLAATASAAPGSEGPKAGEAQWLAILTLSDPGLHNLSSWTDSQRRAGASHFQYWQHLTQEGKVILVGRTLDEEAPGKLSSDAVGLAIFHAADRAAAEAVVAADPGVRAGVWKWKVSSYQVALSR